MPTAKHTATKLTECRQQFPCFCTPWHLNLPPGTGNNAASTAYDRQLSTTPTTSHARPMGCYGMILSTFKPLSQHALIQRPGLDGYTHAANCWSPVLASVGQSCCVGVLLCHTSGSTLSSKDGASWWHSCTLITETLPAVAFRGTAAQKSSFIQRVAIHFSPSTTVSAACMELGSSSPLGRFDLHSTAQHPSTRTQPSSL